MRDGLYPGMTQTEIRRYSISIEIDFEGNSFSGVVSADCVFLSCTNWRAIEAIDVLRSALGVSVLSSNQVTLEASRREALS